MSGRGYIAPEPKGTCEFCQQHRELRPYGPKGERICCECALKDPATTERQMDIYLFGDGQRK